MARHTFGKNRDLAAICDPAKKRVAITKSGKTIYDGTQEFLVNYAQVGPDRKTPLSSVVNDKSHVDLILATVKAANRLYEGETEIDMIGQESWSYDIAVPLDDAPAFYRAVAKHDLLALKDLEFTTKTKGTGTQYRGDEMMAEIIAGQKAVVFSDAKGNHQAACGHPYSRDAIFIRDTDSVSISIFRRAHTVLARAYPLGRETIEGLGIDAGFDGPGAKESEQIRLTRERVVDRQKEDILQMLMSVAAHGFRFGPSGQPDGYDASNNPEDMFLYECDAIAQGLPESEAARRRQALLEALGASQRAHGKAIEARERIKAIAVPSNDPEMVMEAADLVHDAAAEEASASAIFRFGHREEVCSQAAQLATAMADDAPQARALNGHVLAQLAIDSEEPPGEPHIPPGAVERALQKAGVAEARDRDLGKARTQAFAGAIFDVAREKPNDLAAAIGHRTSKPPETPRRRRRASGPRP